VSTPRPHAYEGSRYRAEMGKKKKSKSNSANKSVLQMVEPERSRHRKRGESTYLEEVQELLGPFFHGQS